MKSKELLLTFNKLLNEKEMPFHFSDWDGLTKLTNEELGFIFNKFSDLLSIEGVGQDGELNQLGLVYDEICNKLSLEMTHRPGFKLDVALGKQ